MDIVCIYLHGILRHFINCHDDVPVDVPQTVVDLVFISLHNHSLVSLPLRVYICTFVRPQSSTVLIVFEIYCRFYLSITENKVNCKFQIRSKTRPKIEIAND